MIAVVDGAAVAVRIVVVVVLTSVALEAVIVVVVVSSGKTSFHDIVCTKSRTGVHWRPAF